MLGMRIQPIQSSTTSVLIPSAVNPSENYDSTDINPNIKGFEGLRSVNIVLGTGEDGVSAADVEGSSEDGSGKVRPDLRVGPALGAILGYKPKEIRKAAGRIAVDGADSNCALSAHIRVLLSFLRQSNQTNFKYDDVGSQRGYVKVSRAGSNTDIPDFTMNESCASLANHAGTRLDSPAACASDTKAEDSYARLTADAVSRDLTIPLVDKWLQQRKGTKEKHNIRTAAYALTVALLEIDYASESYQRDAKPYKAHYRGASEALMYSLTRTLRAVKSGGVSEDGRLYLGILEIIRRFAEARSANTLYTIQGSAKEHKSGDASRKNEIVSDRIAKEINTAEVGSSKQDSTLETNIYNNGMTTRSAGIQFYGGCLLSVCAEELMRCMVPDGGSDDRAKSNTLRCSPTRARVNCKLCNHSRESTYQCHKVIRGEDKGDMQTKSGAWCRRQKVPDEVPKCKLADAGTHHRTTLGSCPEGFIRKCRVRTTQNLRVNIPNRANGKAAKAALAVCRAIAEFELHRQQSLPTASLFLNALSTWDFVSTLKTNSEAPSDLTDAEFASQLIRFLIKDAARLLEPQSLCSGCNATVDTDRNDGLDRAHLKGAFERICDVVESYLLASQKKQDVEKLLKGPLATIGKRTCPSELFGSVWECALVYSMHGQSSFPPFADEAIGTHFCSKSAGTATSLVLFLISKVVPKLGYKHTASNPDSCSCDRRDGEYDEHMCDGYLQAFIVRLLDFCMDYQREEEARRKISHVTKHSESTPTNVKDPSEESLTPDTRVANLWLAYIYRHDLAFLSHAWTRRLAKHIANTLQSTDPYTLVAFYGRRDALVTASAHSVLCGAVERWVASDLTDSPTPTHTLAQRETAQQRRSDIGEGRRKTDSGNPNRDATTQQMGPGILDCADAEESCGPVAVSGGLPMSVVQELLRLCELGERLGDCSIPCECEHEQRGSAGCDKTGDSQNSCIYTPHTGENVAVPDGECLADESLVPKLAQIDSEHGGTEYISDPGYCRHYVQLFDAVWIECLTRYAVQSCCVTRDCAQNNKKDSPSTKFDNNSHSSKTSSSGSGTPEDKDNSRHSLELRNDGSCDVCVSIRSIWEDILNKLLRSAEHTPPVLCTRFCESTTTSNSCEAKIHVADCKDTHHRDHTEKDTEPTRRRSSLPILNPLQAILVRIICDSIEYGDDQCAAKTQEQSIALVDGADYTGSGCTVTFESKLAPPVHTTNIGNGCNDQANLVGDEEATLQTGAYKATSIPECMARSKETARVTRDKSEVCTGPKVIELEDEEGVSQTTDTSKSNSHATTQAKAPPSDRLEHSGVRLTVSVDGVVGQIEKTEKPVSWIWDGTAVWHVLLNVCSVYHADSATPHRCKNRHTDAKLTVPAEGVDDAGNFSPSTAEIPDACLPVYSDSIGAVQTEVIRHVVRAWKARIEASDSNHTYQTKGEKVLHNTDQARYDWSKAVHQGLYQTHTTPRRGSKFSARCSGVSKTAQVNDSPDVTANVGPPFTPQNGYYEHLLYRVMRSRPCAASCKNVSPPKRQVRLLLDEVIQLARAKPDHNTPTVMLRAVGTILAHELTALAKHASPAHDDTTPRLDTAMHQAHTDAICTTVLRTLLRYTELSLKSNTLSTDAEDDHHDVEPINGGDRENTKGRKPETHQEPDEKLGGVDRHEAEVRKHAEKGLFERLSPLLLLRCLPTSAFHEGVLSAPYLECAENEGNTVRVSDTDSSEHIINHDHNYGKASSVGKTGTKDSSEQSVGGTLHQLLMQYLSNASEYLETRKVAAELLSRLSPEQVVSDSLETVVRMVDDFEATVASLVKECDGDSSNQQRPPEVPSACPLDRSRQVAPTLEDDSSQPSPIRDASARPQGLCPGLMTAKLLVYTCNMAIARILKSGSRPKCGTDGCNRKNRRHPESSSDSQLGTKCTCLRSMILRSASRVFAAGCPFSDSEPVESVTETKLYNTQTERLRLFIEQAYGEGSVREMGDALRKLKLGVSDLLGISILALSETGEGHGQTVPTSSPGTMSLRTDHLEHAPPVSKVDQKCGTPKIPLVSDTPYDTHRSGVCGAVHMVRWIVTAVGTTTTRSSERLRYAKTTPNGSLQPHQHVTPPPRVNSGGNEYSCIRSDVYQATTHHGCEESANVASNLQARQWLIFGLGCALRLAADKGLYEDASTRLRTWRRIWLEVKPFLLDKVSGAPFVSTECDEFRMYADVPNTPTSRLPRLECPLDAITRYSVLKTVAELHHRQATETTTTGQCDRDYLRVSELCEILHSCLCVLHARTDAEAGLPAEEVSDSPQSTCPSGTATHTTQSGRMAMVIQREDIRLRRVTQIRVSVMATVTPVLHSLATARTRRQFNASAPPLHALQRYLERLIGVELAHWEHAGIHMPCEDSADGDRFEHIRRRDILNTWLQSASDNPSDVLVICRDSGGGWSELYVLQPSLVHAALSALKALNGVL